MAAAAAAAVVTTMFPITQNCRNFQGFKRTFTYHDVLLYAFQNNFTSRPVMHNFLQKSTSHLKIPGTRAVI